jgi:hypothetical protein
MKATYAIELQRVSDGWIWAIEQILWDNPAAGRAGLYEDSDDAFPTAAEAAADAERRIAEIAADIPRRRLAEIIAGH